MDTRRPRARELGIVVGVEPPGRYNAITDVPGVRVGHVTLIWGDGPLRIGEGPVRTGVTAIVRPATPGTTSRWRQAASCSTAPGPPPGCRSTA